MSVILSSCFIQIFGIKIKQPTVIGPHFTTTGPYLQFDIDTMQHMVKRSNYRTAMCFTFFKAVPYCAEFCQKLFKIQHFFPTFSE